MLFVSWLNFGKAAYFADEACFSDREFGTNRRDDLIRRKFHPPGQNSMYALGRLNTTTSLGYCVLENIRALQRRYKRRWFAC